MPSDKAYLFLKCHLPLFPSHALFSSNVATNYLQLFKLALQAYFANTHSPPWEGTWEYKLKSFINKKSGARKWLPFGQIHIFINGALLEHSKALSIAYCLLLLVCFKGKAGKETTYPTCLKWLLSWPFTERVYWPLDKTLIILPKYSLHLRYYYAFKLEIIFSMYTYEVLIGVVRYDSEHTEPDRYNLQFLQLA